MHGHAKLHQNWPNVSKDIVNVWIFHVICMITVICLFFAILGQRVDGNGNFVRCQPSLNAMT